MASNVDIQLLNKRQIDAVRKKVVAGRVDQAKRLVDQYMGRIPSDSPKPSPRRTERDTGPSRPTAPAYDREAEMRREQAYRDRMDRQMRERQEERSELVREGATSAREARDAYIRARQEEQMGEFAGQERQVGRQFEQEQRDIQGDVYEAQERQRATGVQRGIQYSQQQQALEQGISRAGTQMIADARQNRDLALQNIKDRITTLKSRTSYELEASRAQQEADIAKGELSTADIYGQRQYETGARREEQARQERLIREGWSREDATADKNFNRTLELRKMDEASKEKFFEMDADLKREFNQSSQAFQEKMFNMDKQSKEDFFRMDNEAKKEFFNMEQSAKKAFFNMEAKQQEKMFNMNKEAQIAMFNMENDAKKAFFNMETARQTKFLNMKAATQREMFSMQTSAQEKLFNMKSSQQNKFLQMSEDSKMRLMLMEETHKEDYLDKQFKLSGKELERKIQADSEKQMADTVRNYIVNSPEFEMYPQAGGWFTKEFDDKQVKLLHNYMDTLGISNEQQYKMIKDQNAVDSVFGVDYDGLMKTLGVGN